MVQLFTFLHVYIPMSCDVVAPSINKMSVFLYTLNKV